jgi:Flp pilus assembly protein TadG
MKIAASIRSQRGAAALEFGIVLTLLVVLAVGLCEFGVMYYDKQVITNASREGARAGTTRAEESDESDEITQIVNAYCQDRLITLSGSAEPQTYFPFGIDIASKAFQDDFSVRVTYQYQFLVPSLIGLGPTLTLEAITVMKMEAPEPT